MGLLSSSMPAPSKAIGIFCVIGLSLSCYAIYVENQIEESAALGGEYVALCDVSSWGMSCSKVFTCPEGRMLHLITGVEAFKPFTNAVAGAVLYPTVFMSFLRSLASSALCASPSAVGSLGLGFLLLTKLG